MVEVPAQMRVTAKLLEHVEELPWHFKGELSNAQLGLQGCRYCIDAPRYADYGRCIKHVWVLGHAKFDRDFAYPRYLVSIEMGGDHPDPIRESLSKCSYVKAAWLTELFASTGTPQQPVATPMSIASTPSSAYSGSPFTPSTPSTYASAYSSTPTPAPAPAAGPPYASAPQLRTAVPEVDERTEINTHLVVAGQVFATGYFTWSDERLKRDITQLSADVRDRLRSIGTYVYKYKEHVERGDEQHIGLIAQEVQRYFPQAVKKTPSQYLAVDYEQLVPVVIKVVQQLDGEIVTLAEEVRKMRFSGRPQFTPTTLRTFLSHNAVGLMNDRDSTRLTTVDEAFKYKYLIFTSTNRQRFHVCAGKPEGPAGEQTFRGDAVWIVDGAAATAFEIMPCKAVVHNVLPRRISTEHALSLRPLGHQPESRTPKYMMHGKSTGVFIREVDDRNVLQLMQASWRLVQSPRWGESVFSLVSIAEPEQFFWRHYDFRLRISPYDDKDEKLFQDSGFFVYGVGRID
eukprot:TRINITY_DN4345_c0_g1_i1.p1 TRINITY_DN4345_c0_g1~~TRINITY_DN4345_c0_g1_i1.p1  ORF type:complete len:513 (+),score=90.19 TRINITY_DN4345_c0_g1_i1:171-1709(+)